MHQGPFLFTTCTSLCSSCAIKPTSAHNCHFKPLIVCGDTLQRTRNLDLLPSVRRDGDISQQYPLSSFRNRLSTQKSHQKRIREHKLLLAKHELYVNELLVLIDLDDLPLSKFLVINNIACLNPL